MARIVICSLFTLFLVPVLLRAHPVPKDNHDRTILVHLSRDGVIVDYRLEVDEYRAVRDMRLADLKDVTSRKDIHLAFRKYAASVIGENIVATLDGKELTFRCVEQRSQVLDHVRCDFRFIADWKLSPGKSHQFVFREGNYPLDGFSYIAVRLSHSSKVTLDDVTVPDAELIERSADRRRPGDDERLRTIRATIRDEPSFQGGAVKPPLPPGLDEVRPGVIGLSRYASAGRSPARDQVGIARNNPPVAEDAGPERHRSHLLELLLDTKQGLIVLIVLAAVFGAAHALTPGHGKTLVAAYLIGQHGTIWHALVLGLVTTLTHTGSVIILAVLLAWFDLGTSSAATVLNLIGGLLIAGMGVWLLMQRLTGRADHIHVGGGHEVPDLSQPGASWWTTVLMGMTGGIVPCWDAIILLLFAISVQRLWLGVGLLLSFSAGLAGVLVALGVLVVAASAGARWVWRDNSRFERMVRWLPIFSAVAIIIIGLVMTFGSVQAG